MGKVGRPRGEPKTQFGGQIKIDDDQQIRKAAEAIDKPLQRFFVDAALKEAKRVLRNKGE